MVKRWKAVPFTCIWHFFEWHGLSLSHWPLLCTRPRSRRTTTTTTTTLATFFWKKNEFLTAGETAETKCAEVRFCSKCYLWLELFFVCRELLPLFCFIWLIARVNCLTGYNFLNWYLTLYVRCILSWGRALGPLGGLSTGQLNCCLPRLEEKREKSTSELSEIR